MVAKFLLMLSCLFAGVAGAQSQTEVSTHIRILAASCAACHGTNGVSVGTTPSLAGLPRQDFVERMMRFRGSEHASDVMTQHARGLTEVEIRQLGEYFADLPAPQ